MAKTYKILVNDGKGTDIKPVPVTQGAGAKGEPVRMVAKRGWRFELQDDLKGKDLAPDQVRVKRIGKNLAIMFDGSQNADVVIEDFYAENKDDDKDNGIPTLVGMAENGGTYEYVPQDPAASSMPASLKDGNTPVIVSLGGGPLTGDFVLAGLPLVAAAGGGLGLGALAGGALLVAAAAGGGKGGGGDSVVTTPAVAITKVTDNVGSIQNDVPNNGVTDDATPTLVGTATANSVVTIKEGATVIGSTTTDANGNWSFTPPIKQLDGKHTYSAVVTAAGVTSTSDYVVNIDTVGPTPGPSPVGTTQLSVNVIAGDDVINASEAGVAKTTISGVATGEFKANDVVTLKLGTAVIGTGTVNSAGVYSIDVNTTDLTGASTKTVTVELEAHDASNNSGTITATHSYTVDTVGPTPGPSPVGTTQLSVSVIAGDDVINASEAGVAKTTISGVATGEFKANDVVTLKLGTAVIGTGTVNSAGVYSIDVKTTDLTSLNTKTLKAELVAHDSAGNTGTIEATHSYNIDLNPPTINSSTTARVDENTPIGKTVYTVTAKDTGFNFPATENSLTYSLKSGADDSDKFLVDSSGNVTLKIVPNFEAKNSYKFTLIATDAAGNTSEINVTLGVNNLDEVPPTFRSSAVAAAVNENISVNTVIYTANAIDTDFNAPNTANSVTYKLGSSNVGDDSSLFSIDASTGAVKLISSPNYELKHSYNFTVQAFDAANNVSEQKVSLSINDVSEAALIKYDIEPGRYTTTTPNPATPLQWTLRVIDQDAGQATLSTLSSLDGTYGTFSFVKEYVDATNFAGILQWKYELAGSLLNDKRLTQNNNLISLASEDVIGHDLMVVKSLDGSAYQTVDIALNSGAAKQNQTFNTTTTEGLVVSGDATKTDTLVLHGTAQSDLVLDLTAATDKGATLNNIEQIDLSGSANYILKLNSDSLLQNGSQRLLVFGSKDGVDTVSFTGATHTSMNDTTVNGLDFVDYHYSIMKNDQTFELDLLVQKTITSSIS